MSLHDQEQNDANGTPMDSIKPLEIIEPSMVISLLGPGQGDRTFVLDTRPFLSFNKAHISGAINAYYPPILIRRGIEPGNFSSIIRNNDIMANLKFGRFDNIIIYDEEGTFNTELRPNCSECVHSKAGSLSSSHSDNCNCSICLHIRLIISSLLMALPKTAQSPIKLFYLQGGFANFTRLAQTNKFIIRERIVSSAASIIGGASFPKTADFCLKTEMITPATHDLLPPSAFASASNQLAKGSFVNEGHFSAPSSPLEFNFGSGEGNYWSAKSLVMDTVRCAPSQDQGDPVEVLPWLYIGNAAQAARRSRLLDLGITALLNVAETPATPSTVISGRDYFKSGTNPTSSAVELGKDENNDELHSPKDSICNFDMFSSKQRKGINCTNVKYHGQFGLSLTTDECHREGENMRFKELVVPENDGGEIFSHKSIPIVDSATADIIGKLPEAINFIEKVRKEGGRCLVHCLAGISRSATICIAYLMKIKSMTLDAAHDFLKQKRPLISPNLNFLQQLTEFQAQLKINNDLKSLEGSDDRLEIVHSTCKFREKMSMNSTKSPGSESGLNIKSSLQTSLNKNLSNDLSFNNEHSEQPNHSSNKANCSIKISVCESLINSSNYDIKTIETNMSDDIPYFGERNDQLTLEKAKVKDSSSQLSLEHLLQQSSSIEPFRSNQIEASRKRFCSLSTDFLCDLANFADNESDLHAAIKRSRFSFDFSPGGVFSSPAALCHSPLLSPS